MNRFMCFLSKHRWKFYLLWPLAGILLWAFLAYEAIMANPDGAPGIYVYLAFVLWLIVHVLPVILLAVVILIWRWRKTKRNAKN